MRPSLNSATIFLLAWLSTTQVISQTIGVDRILSTAATKLAAHDAANSNKTRYPNEASNTSATSSWDTIHNLNWVSGFYPGALWQIHDYTRASGWSDRAAVWTAGLEGNKTRNGTHDLGFMMNNSFGNGYRLTGNEAYRDVVLTSAESLSQRYDPDVGMLRAWGGVDVTTNFLTIVDTMMNIEMLFWAADQGGVASGGTSEDLYNMAVSHADQTRLNHVRPDGSSFHIVNYDPTDGSIKRRYTGQGKADESTWSRGQAWGLYGFTTTFRETGEIRFLETARSMADYFIDNLPEDGVPLADFDSEHTTLPHKDSTAAAIAASGIFELSRIDTDPANRQRYFDAGVDLLDALTSESSEYFSQSLDESPGLLLHGSRRYQAEDPGDDKSYVWADYYLVEATLRYASQALPGDFDFNGTLSASDLDIIAEELRNGTEFYRYDLNLDGEADHTDHGHWISEVYGTFPGDADLDLEVTFADFLTLGANFGDVGGWSQGDYTGDGIIDFGDFVVFSQHFGRIGTGPAAAPPMSPQALAAVPEPRTSMAFMLAVALGTVYAAGRRRRSTTGE